MPVAPAGKASGMTESASPRSSPDVSSRSPTSSARAVTRVRPARRLGGKGVRWSIIGQGYHRGVVRKKPAAGAEILRNRQFQLRGTLHGHWGYCAQAKPNRVVFASLSK